MEFVSICIGVLALIVSIGSVWYARHSVIASERSAIASESSAQTAREALTFQHETRASEQSDRQEDKIASLVKEVRDQKYIKGDVFWILERETNLSNEDQDEIVHRFYHELGHSREREQKDLKEWRAERTPKK